MNYADIPDQVARIKDLKAFAEKAGVARGTLYNVKNRKGEHGPSLRTLKRIADAIKLHKPAMKPKPCPSGSGD